MVSHPSPFTGLPNRPASLTLTHNPCCLCDVEDAKSLAVGEDFEYRTSPDTFNAVQCRRCSLVYLNPRPSMDDLDQIYPPNYHAFQFSAAQFGLAYTVRRRLEAYRLMSFCEGFAANARILDVGCGDGFHLGLLKEFGDPTWVLDGVDASARAVEAACEAGIQVYQGTVQSAGLIPESYDLIFLIATIEHVADPVDVMFAVRNLLKPGGRVVIVTDNTDTLDFSLFRNRHWGGYHFPRHWNLFSESTLRRLALLTSLQVDTVETIVSPVNWVYSIRNFLEDEGAPSWLVNQFSLKTPITLAIFTIVDAVFQLFGHGALLRATFQKEV